ncbi:MAG: anti-sigma factor [Candidatus Binatia bacterium]
MECKDLQKLLSPFIDNELGAQDAFEVAEHLEHCETCQNELNILRQVDEQLKTVGQTPVAGVEEFRARILNTLPAQPLPRRWRIVGMAAAVLLFLVAGRQLFSAPDDPETAAFSDALISEVKLNTDQPFSLAWLDPRSTQNVLLQEGLEEIPNLAPAGFHLEGARICRPLGRIFLQLVYRKNNEEVSLFISKRWHRPLSGIVKREGFTIVPVGMRAVYLVTKEDLVNFSDTRQLTEEEVSALSS